MQRLMDKTRLIFIEGIMGSGKTTTGEWLSGHVRQQGVDARFLAEGPTTSHPVHPLRVSADLAHPLAVWLDLTIEEYIDCSLDKWQQFVHRARREAAITVCDGLLFHGNMTDLLLMDATSAVLQDYVADVIAILQELAPILLYSRQLDVVRALRAVCDERGRDWEAYQVAWKVESSPYGIARGLRGFVGLTQLYLDYCARCDEIVAKLALPKLAYNPIGDWESYRRSILSFLVAPPPTIAATGEDH